MVRTVVEVTARRAVIPAKAGIQPYFLLALALLVSPAFANDKRPPTIDEMVGFQRASQPAISPEGSRVAWVVRRANWDENSFENDIWIADVATGVSSARVLTRSKKNSDAPAFSPDSKSIAFGSDRDGKRQVYLLDLSGGDAKAITTAEEGVGRFAWSRDGRKLAYVARDPKPDGVKERDKRWSESVVIEDEDTRPAHLYVLDLATGVSKRLTSGTFVVGDFDWSPDDREIAFDFSRSADPSFSVTTNISVVDVETGAIRELVTQEAPDGGPRWSPDGTQIAFRTAMGNVSSFYYLNSQIAVTPSGRGGAATKSIRSITTTFDEDANLLAWSKSGILFSANLKTETGLFTLDPATGRAERLGSLGHPVTTGFSFDRDFGAAAFVGSGPSTYPDVFVASLRGGGSAKRISNLGAQFDSLTVGTSEVVTWKSVDGATIEGALRKPAGWTPGKPAPLLVLIHGGPTGISRPTYFGGTYVYPVEAWLAKGALVLEPNYRGSAGYGEKFRSLNVRNLGVGDAWDVVSGIDALIARGIVDRTKVGAMGWSQGGYISMFLTTHDSARFRAISAGAGISNWMTYYVNTDIHPFTRQYLKATPWDDPAIYAKTSPMTYIKGAKAPTLIQHGDQDARVPYPNALELYQGLRDQGVATRLQTFKGFGHGINKPKAIRAAMEENLAWFDKYLFDAAR